jgi:hypothetical protein
MVLRSMFLVAGLCLSQSVAAVCYYEGKAYPTGARVGVYVCQPDGTWRRVASRFEIAPRSFEIAARSPSVVASFIMRRASQHARV